MTVAAPCLGKRDTLVNMETPGSAPADAALAALSDKPELQRAENSSPAATEAQDREWADTFNPKILALARGFADAPPPDFAKASFAELYAWSLAQPPAE